MSYYRVYSLKVGRNKNLEKKTEECTLGSNNVIVIVMISMVRVCMFGTNACSYAYWYFNSKVYSCIIMYCVPLEDEDSINY